MEEYPLGHEVDFWTEFKFHCQRFAQACQMNFERKEWEEEFRKSENERALNSLKYHLSLNILIIMSHLFSGYYLTMVIYTAPNIIALAAIRRRP